MTRRGSRFGTIRLRLTSWYVFLLALTLLAFSAFVSVRLERSLLDQSDDLLRSSAFQVRGLLFPIELAVSARRIDAADDVLLRDFATQPGLIRVARGLRENGILIRVVDPEGRVPATTTVTDEGLPADIPIEPGFYVATSPGGDLVRVYSIPLEMRDPKAPGESRLLGWVQTGRSISAWQRSILVLRAQMILGIPLALFLAGLGGLFLASRALRPIDRITRTAQAISARDLSRRIAYDGPPDEVGRLATTFDQMLDRIESGFERERRFTADASHELRTPLAAMKGYQTQSLCSQIKTVFTCYSISLCRSERPQACSTGCVR
jgi:HAMP domain-containing protein